MQLSVLAESILVTARGESFLSPDTRSIAERLGCPAAQAATQLAEEGRFNEAADHYRSELNLRSNDSRLFVGLASVLIRLNEIDGAVLAAERAAQLSVRNDPNVMSLLASAYAAAGRMADAAAAADRARGLAEAAGLADLAAELRLRVAQYRKGGGV